MYLYVKSCIFLLQQTDAHSIDYELYRSACVKEFEIILEQSGKLLKKILISYFHSHKAISELTFKDIFRQAVLKNLIDEKSGERWLIYRDNRNITAHDYGVGFVQETMLLLPQFIVDANALLEIMKRKDIENES